MTMQAREYSVKVEELEGVLRVGTVGQRRSGTAAVRCLLILAIGCRRAGFTGFKSWVQKLKGEVAELS